MSERDVAGMADGVTGQDADGATNFSLEVIK